MLHNGLVKNTKNKVIIILIIALLITLGVFVFLWRKEKSERLSAENKYAEEKKEALRKLSDSLNNSFKNKTIKFENEIKLLQNQEKEIKYIPYEKTIYINRTLDEALDVFARHPANRKSESQN